MMKTLFFLVFQQLYFGVVNFGIFAGVEANVWSAASRIHPIHQ
jgi:hypothetical protein